MSIFSIEVAAGLLGISGDTLRRWAEAGHLATTPTTSGQCAVDGAELARFATTLNTAPSDPLACPQVQAANEFPGLVTRVTRDHHMALVEIQAGPHRIISLMPLEVVDQLKLEPGARAVASLKSATVIVRPEPPRHRPPM